MLVRTVRIDLVDDELEPEVVRALDQLVKVGERSEHRVDAAIIGDVIAKVAHRRGEEGRKPDGVHSQARDVIEPFRNSGQVTDPVAVRVGKAARVDLVDGRALPPWESG